MFANTQMMGIDMGFPDVCLTPTPAPVPIPYPNIAMGPMGVPAVYNVLIGMAPAHNMATTIPISNGDNPGINLGVASGMVMGPARVVLGAVTTIIGGMPATRMTNPTIQNSTNCPGVRVVPSQAKVLILSK
ncbi:MAG: DUF4150 domain-containing protein [Polyangiaceae bacterium]|jgi:hypothetical protein|nr:DUF4150 domain-containing protein [Polyangiaceae bacterium]MBK8941289.1 DUF4150 domain-containing protein [Polyangiaceae bacterium]